MTQVSNSVDQQRKIVITILGRVDEYSQSKHYDQTAQYICETKFVAEYMVHKYQPDYMFLMYLDFEKEITWDAAITLTEKLDSQSVAYREMALTALKSSESPNNYDWDALLWEIVRKVNREIGEFTPDDHIYIDITHGFRTMPYMLMGVFRYLSIIKGIKNITITYGNKIDATDVGDVLPHVYFAEITAFDDLNRWIDAASAFVRFGFSNDLCREIKNIRVDGLRSRLDDLAGRLRKITHTLHMVQWVDYVADFKALNDSLVKLVNAEKYSELPAFVMYVVEWLQTELASMFQYDDANNIQHHVHIQTQVLRWYRNNEMYAHALLLARELLLTKALVAGVVREKHTGTWNGSEFSRKSYVDTKIVALTAANESAAANEHLMNDFIRQSNQFRYVRLGNDYGHGYWYELHAEKLYPLKFESRYLENSIAFGKLVFDMRNDIGHGMGDSSDLLNPNLILEVIDAVINNTKYAQPVVPSLS
jgi:CRISPR-associated DxTHG motif protein